MSRERQEPIFKDFDLTVEYFANVEFYGGPRERGEQPPQDQIPEEAPEVLDLETLKMAMGHEAGFGIASITAKTVKKPEDIAFAREYLGSASLISAWKLFAENAHGQVMRRRLKLPFLATDSPEHRQSTDDLLCESGYLLSESRVATSVLVEMVQNNRERDAKVQQRKIGRIAGKAALTIANAELGDQLIEHPLSKADTQLLVRQRCLQLVRTSRILTQTICEAPSIDQLADYDSRLSVQWRREAPDGAWRAYHEAREIVAETMPARLDLQGLFYKEQFAGLV